MADNSETIGGVQVTVSADLSDLAQQFASAQTDATAAGEAIAGAFNTSITGISDFDAALQQAASTSTEAASSIEQVGTAASGATGDVATLGEELTTTGTSADTAASCTTAFGDAADAAGSAAAEAETGLSGMAEKMVALGEALVIAEGLKVFGEDALTASDNITHASIALTTLTGNAESTKTTLEGLEQLGISDGLSMPSLLTAGTRMTAMLPPGTDVVNLLGDIANGASVMGTDIESAATKFDQMVTAGTASVRTLTQLGLNLTGLAAAFNQVIPGSDATAASVAGMFKALSDPDQRIAILTAALSTMGGTAHSVADQTFGGQWNQLVAQWDQSMVEAGQALMPVVSGLLDLLKVDVLPFVKSLVDDFTAMPAPVQEAAIVLGVLGAAVTVAGLAIKTLGLAVAPIAGLFDALSASSLTAAASEDVAATAAETAAAAQATLGASTAAAGVEMEAGGIAATGLGGILGGILVTGLSAAVFSLVDLKDKLDAAHSSLKQFTDTAINASLTSFLKELSEGSVDAGELADAQKRVTDAMAAGIGNRQLEVDVLRSIEQQMNLLTGAETGYVAQLHVSTAATDAATDSVSVHAAAVADAQTKVNALTTAYAAHQATSEQLLTAENTLASAQAALNKATADADASTQHWASDQDIAWASAQEGANEILLLQRNVTATGQAYVQSQEAVDAATVSLNKSSAAGKDEQAAQVALTKALTDNVTASTNYQNAQDKLVAGQAAATASAKDAQTAADNLAAAQLKGMAANDDILASFLALDPQLQGVADALHKDADAYAYASNAIVPWTAQVIGQPGQLKLLETELAQAEAHFNTLSTSMDNSAKSAQNLISAESAVLKAQIALDEYNAMTATGLGGLTDSVSLATVALAAAKAKLADLTAAYQDNILLEPQVKAAQDAVTAAQNNLNTALGLTPDKANAAGTAVSNMGKTAAAAAPGIASATFALGNMQTSVNGLVYSQSQLPASAASAVTAITSVGTAASAATVAVDALDAAMNGLGSGMGQTGGSFQMGLGGVNEADLIAAGILKLIPGSAQANVFNAQQAGDLQGIAPQKVDPAIVASLLGLTLAEYNAGYRNPQDVPANFGQASTASSTGAASTTTATASTGVQQGGPIIGSTPVGLGLPGATATTSGTSTAVTTTGGAMLVDELSGGTLYTQLADIGATLGPSASQDIATSAAASAASAAAAATTGATTATAVTSVATSTSAAAATSATTAAAISNVASAVSATASTATAMTTAASAITNVATSIQSVVAAVQTIAQAALKNVLGAPVNTTLPTTVGTVTGGGGTNTYGGTTTTTIGGTGAIGPGGTYSFNFSGANFAGSGVTPATVMAAVTQALYTAGARFPQR